MFCSNCGSNISDDAKFCASCGAQITTPGNMMPKSTVPENSVTNNMTGEGISPAASNNVFTSTQAQPVENVNNSQPVSNDPFASQSIPNATDSVNNTQPASNDPFASQYASNSTGNAFNNQAQPAFSNGMTPDGTNWNPLMQPKKKSKAPIIIALTSIALLIVIAVVIVCVFACSGGGSSTPQELVENVFEIASDGDITELSDYVCPVYVGMFDAASKEDVFEEEYDSEDEALLDFLESYIDSTLNIEDGFDYDNLKVEDVEKYSKSEVKDIEDELKEYLEYFLDSADSQGYDLDLDPDDYSLDGAAEMGGTVEVDGDDYEFEASAVEMDGNWYLVDLEVY